MTVLEVTTIRAAKIWWCITWRAALITILFGCAVSLVSLLIFAPLGLGPEAAGGFTGDGAPWFLGIPLSILIGIWVTRMALTKHYLEFDIALIKPEPKTRSESETAEPDPAQMPPLAMV